jgi:hypothetical protein
VQMGMDVMQLKFEQPDGTSLYRYMPVSIMHPRKAQQLSQQEFTSLSKQKIVETPSLGKGHAGTDLWYSGEAPTHFYILQIKFEKSWFGKKPDMFYRSLCTFTPQFGVDVCDGWFCADVEAYVSEQTLKFPAGSLDIFRNRDSMPMLDYLRAHGFPAPAE